MNRRSFLKMLGAAMTVPMALHLSRGVELVVGRLKPPSGSYLKYDGVWYTLGFQRTAACDYNRIEGDDRVLGDPLPPDEQNWLEDSSVFWDDRLDTGWVADFLVVSENSNVAATYV